jgi:hypothetical protein
MNSDTIQVHASLLLPAGWKFARTLPVLSENTDGFQLKEVSLTELVDSPAIIGENDGVVLNMAPLWELAP